MKTRLTSRRQIETGIAKLGPFPDEAHLAAFRAWLNGLSCREAVARYLDSSMADGRSSRGVIGGIRSQLIAYALDRRRNDLAEICRRAQPFNQKQVRAVVDAIETLRGLPPSSPHITDDVSMWLSPRTVRVLNAEGIKTLAALTVRVPRRRRWWVAIPGLGVTGARQVEAFFADHPYLTERARELIARQAQDTQQGSGQATIVPWESIHLPEDLDGSRGTFRAPRSTCALEADNDYAAVQAWLALHESPATIRAYKKEAERLLLWAIVERGRALSSLTQEDAVAYRTFLRHPTPRSRWIGPARPRLSAEWRPFSGDLAPTSIAYSLSVLGAMFRWLIEQRYVLTNPFAGLKVRGATRSDSEMVSRAFSEGEWTLIQTVAQGLEWSYGWEPASAQRLRFVIDFAYATGLRASELVDSKLGQIEADVHGTRWLKLVGKGSKPGRVALPPLATSALDRYLVQRGLPITTAKWNPTVCVRQSHLELAR